MYVREHFYIGGSWVPADASVIRPVISPATEEEIGRAPLAGIADMERAIAAARAAFDSGPWPRMPMDERAAVLARLSAELRVRVPEVAGLLAEETGFLLTLAPRMIERGIAYLDDALAAAPALLEPELRRDQASLGLSGSPGIGLITREPAGVVGAIVPWNGPFFMALSKVMPALAVGCTVVLKPPAEAPLNCFLIAEACDAAGLPAGVLNILPGGGEIGEYLVRHRDVDVVSFTGSTAVGQRIGSICGEQVKRACLELGGKSAAILLEDVDLSAAAHHLSVGIFGGAGQACVALSRILAPRARYDETVALMCDRARQQIVGNPLLPSTTMGPLISEKQRNRVESCIDIGTKEGARLACGGSRPTHLNRGWYIEPTVFADVDNEMRIAQEEIFGPVVCVIPYENMDEAVRLANASSYGLGGAVFTSDEQAGLAVARRIRTGTVAINTYGHTVSSPFGGMKLSGLGREHGREGIEEYLEYKAINIPSALADAFETRRTAPDMNPLK